MTAVVTTGIYCRPGCGAEPLSRNTREFPLAAAAEAAGFRACLRCRPYRSPVVVGADAPEQVCRAVQLVLDGMLDDATEADLARRLGVSSRHLRRLFATYLGVSPDGLARSARAHSARRLLDDTDLSITEIAFMAGFGSLRQFNRVCRAVFRESPGELRARRRRSDRLVADGGLALRLTFAGELDWSATIAQLGVTAIPGVEHVDGGVYRRTILVADSPGAVELKPGGADHLVLIAHLPRWREVVHVVDRVRRVAALDADIAAAARSLESDPDVGSLVRARPGVRPVGAWDPYEVGVRLIIGQQLSSDELVEAMARVVGRYGTPVAGLRQLGLTHTFPPAQVLVRANLTECDLTAHAATAVRAFARAVSEDTIRLDRSVGLDSFVRSVTAIDGVTAQTAHHIATRMGEPDACPLPVGQRWHRWRAFAYAYLSLAARAAATEEKGAA